MQAKREWYNIFKVMIVKNLQLSVLYPVRLSFTFEGGIKSITDKQKPKEFSTTRPVLQQMIKELL